MEAISLHLLRTHAECSYGRCSYAQTTSIPRTIDIVGERIAVKRKPALSQRSFSLPSGKSKTLGHIDEQQMIIRTSGTHAVIPSD